MEGKAKMMRIYIGEADRWKDKPLYKALVEAMRANDIAGVTVYRGILGYGAHRRMHKDKALHLSHDCSIMLSAVDTEEKLHPFFRLWIRWWKRVCRAVERGHHQVFLPRTGR
jgi:PII-like signaling protein